jgi:hypothetical protein
MNLLNAQQRLVNGKTIKIKTSGSSMSGKVDNGSFVTIEPVGDRTLKKKDIVLAKVNGRLYLHLITGTREDSFQISNNHGHVNGWALKKNVFGIVTKVEKS